MLRWQKIALGLVVLALSGTALAGVDLTPSPTQVEEDGVKYQQIRFKSEEQGSVIFLPPENWSFRGGAGRLQLTPPGKDFAEASIEAASFPAPRPLDAAAIEAFKQEVLAGLPAGSGKIETVIEAENTVMPGGNPSFELAVTYSLWGKEFQRSALLVHTPRERLVFRLTAQKQDFGALLNQFRRSVMSWQFVETKPPAAPGAATPVPGS